MVAPIGNIANKFFFSSTFSSSTTSNSQSSALPTVSSSNHTGMDIPTRQAPVHSFEIRGRTPTTEINLSRESSMSSGWATPYSDRMDNMDVDSEPGDNSPELSYKTEQEKANCVSKANETTDNIRLQAGNNKAIHSNSECVFNANQSKHVPHAKTLQDDNNNVINIQLPYDLNSPTKPDLWSSSFHPISLHGFIKQITSNFKSIRDSLNFMARYITNKKVKSSNTNDLLDFDSMGDSIWNFISSVYQSNWDLFYTDNKSITLRAKILSKFTPRIPPTTNKNNKETTKPILVSIEKIPLPPPLPAKLKREVNVISKYFQNSKSSVKAKKLSETKKPAILYAQASRPMTNTSEVLKIKEAFLALNAKKINQINNIVKGNSKPKPHIQMITKGLSKKQVIIPMSSNNISVFMKNLFLHVTNINRQLQNVKSEVLVNYIRSDPFGITIITNRVSQQSDLLIIDQYIKNSNDINALQVEEPRLPKSKSYLKIIGILFYLYDNSQEHLTSSNIKTVLKQNQIFNNITLVSRPRYYELRSLGLDNRTTLVLSNIRELDRVPSTK